MGQPRMDYCIDTDNIGHTMYRSKQHKAQYNTEN